MEDMKGQEDVKLQKEKEDIINMILQEDYESGKDNQDGK